MPRSGSKRSPRPTTSSGDEEKRTSYDRVREMGASGVRTGARGPRRGAARAVPAGGQRAIRAASTWATSATCSVGCSGRRVAGGGRVQTSGRSAGADLETDGHDRVRGRDDGTTVPVQDHRPGRVSHLSRIGRRAGHPARSRCPAVRRGRDRQREPGVLPMAQPCPRVPGSRAHRGAPVSHLPRHRRRSAGRGKFQVKIPAGVKDGARIKLAGRGEPGPAGGNPATSTCASGSASSRVRPQGRQPDAGPAGHLSRGGARRQRARCRR